MSSEDAVNLPQDSGSKNLENKDKQQGEGGKKDPKRCRVVVLNKRIFLWGKSLFTLTCLVPGKGLRGKLSAN